MKLKPIKVSLLNQYVKKCLKSNSIFYNLYVEGEISNIRISKTGYTYFTLSDENSSISCVCFYQDSSVVDGDKVIVNGELTVYEVKGTYQIIVNNIEKTGLGNIFKELELLKAKLREKGLFDNNKEIPLLPSRIGIVTSKSGAAIKDILKTFNAVNGSFDIFIYDSLVQGELARESIVDGISYFNNKEIVDVILLSRGGGSFEDLKIFNDLIIAENIYMSKIPVVTGIGHDTDITLSDYTADVHCHTPTAAAEYIVRGYKNIDIQLENLYRDLKNRTKNELKYIESNLNTYRYVLKTYNPRDVISKHINECNMQNTRFVNLFNNEIKTRQNMLDLLYEKLLSHDYRTQLKNGYSLVFNSENQLIKSVDNASEGSNINILFEKFSIKAKVEKIEEV